MCIGGRWWVSFWFRFNDWVGPGVDLISWGLVNRKLSPVYTDWFGIIGFIWWIVFRWVELREYLFVGWVGGCGSL